MNNQKITKLRLAGLKAAVVLVLVSITMLFVNGLNFGIDFTGGVLTRFTTAEPVASQQMQEILTEHVQGKFDVNSAKNSTEWSVRQPAHEKTEHYNEWMDRINQAGEIGVKFLDSDFIGPQVGDELVNQGGLAMLASLIAIMLYLAVRFEWRLAAGSIAALFHDVIVVLGVFAAFGLEFDLSVLAAILAVIGYSLNDSIIVADRMRELMRMNKDSKLDKIVNAAIASTMTRTLITSGTTLATISSIWFLAGSPLEGFAVSLFVGILVGTLSSICISATIPGLLGLDVDHYKVKPDGEQVLEP